MKKEALYRCNAWEECPKGDCHRWKPRVKAEVSFVEDFNSECPEIHKNVRTTRVKK